MEIERKKEGKEIGWVMKYQGRKRKGKKGEQEVREKRKVRNRQRVGKRKRRLGDGKVGKRKVGKVRKRVGQGRGS